MGTCWTTAETVNLMQGTRVHLAIVRHLPGGPPAVRNLEWIYGPPSNSPAQQAEADAVSVLAIRTTLLCCWARSYIPSGGERSQRRDAGEPTWQ